LVHIFFALSVSVFGAFRVLADNVILGILSLVIALAASLGPLKFLLPRLAHPEKRRSDVFLQALAVSAAGGYAAFLIIVAFARSGKVELDWIGPSAWSGGLIGLVLWCYWQYEHYAQSREISTHQAAVVESKRLWELDAPKDAEDKLKESLLRCEFFFGSNHVQSAQAAIDLARFYQNQGSRHRAAAMFHRAVTIRSKMLPEDDLRIASVLMEWVSADDDMNPEEAIRQLRKALLTLEKQLGPYAGPVALAYERIGELQQKQGQLGEAETALRRSCSILRKGEQVTSPKDLFRISLRLARCYMESKKFAEATEILSGLEELNNIQKPEMQLEYLQVQVSLHQQQDNPAAAQEKAWQALQLLQRDLGPTFSEIKSIWESGLDQLSKPFGHPEARQVLQAIQGGDTYQIKQLLANHPDWMQQLDASGWNFVQWACFFGQERVLESLVGLGGSLDCAGEWPPLHIACRWGHRRLLSNLLPKVDNINKPAKGGWHILHRCAQNGDDRILEVMTASDLNVNAVNDRGDTPLLLACRHGHYRLVVALVSRGAETNKVNPQSGRSPLHEVAYLGHRALAECLLLNGSRVDSRDRAGLTPAELAQQAEHTAMVQQLQTYARGLKH